MAENLEGLRRLSEVMQQAKKPTTYAREFMRAAENGEFTGVVVLADRIAIKPSRKGGKARYIQDFAVIETPDFADWHDKYLASEGAARGLPRYDDLRAGAVDLDAAQQMTLEYLNKRRRRSEQTAASIRRKKENTTAPADGPTEE